MNCMFCGQEVRDHSQRPFKTVDGQVKCVVRRAVPHKDGTGMQIFDEEFITTEDK